MLLFAPELYGKGGFSFFLENVWTIFWWGNSTWYFAPLWFVLTLYIISVTYYMFQLYFKRLVYSICVVIICVIFCILFSNVQLPFKFGTMILCFSFFVIGNLVKRKDCFCFFGTEGMGKKILFGGIGLVITLLIVDNTKEPTLIAMNSVGNPISFYLESFICVFCSIILCSSVNKFGFIGKILQFISRNALVILATHYYVIIRISGSLKALHFFCDEKLDEVCCYFFFFIIICVIEYLLVLFLIDICIFFWEKLKKCSFFN